MYARFMDERPTIEQVFAKLGEPRPAQLDGYRRPFASYPSRLTAEEIEVLLDHYAPPRIIGPTMYIWDAIDRIMADVTEEELAMIPPSDHVDHALYGAPIPPGSPACRQPCCVGKRPQDADASP